MSKERVPAVQGWFTMDAADPRLLGNRCTSCKSYFFPKAKHFCPNPNCTGSEFEEVPLSRRGKIWSFTNNCYQPPAPYVSPDPFVPYTVAAVELDEEKMVVLGQVVSGVGVDQLKAGMEVELVLDKLFEDAEKEYVVWKWKPVS
jgi:hypothetical protein